MTDLGGIKPTGYSFSRSNSNNTQNTQNNSMASNNTNTTGIADIVLVADPIHPNRNICCSNKAVLYSSQLKSRLPTLLKKLMKNGLLDIQRQLELSDSAYSANAIDTTSVLPQCSRMLKRRTASYEELWNKIPIQTEPIPLLSHGYASVFQGLFTDSSSLLPSKRNVFTEVEKYEDYNTKLPANQSVIGSELSNFRDVRSFDRTKQTSRSSVLLKQDEQCYTKSIETVEKIIRQAELVASTKVTTI